MYKQEKKAGFIHYILCMIVLICIWIFCDLVALYINNTLFADILFVVSASTVVYAVYRHYCAVYVYELLKKRLIVTRTIGKRVLKEEIPLSKINGIYSKKPDNLKGKFGVFTVNILKKDDRCYLVYNKGRDCIVFEPDKELKNLLKESYNV